MRENPKAAYLHPRHSNTTSDLAFSLSQTTKQTNTTMKVAASYHQRCSQHCWHSDDDAYKQSVTRKKYNAIKNRGSDEQSCQCGTANDDMIVATTLTRSLPKVSFNNLSLSLVHNQICANFNFASVIFDK